MPIPELTHLQVFVIGQLIDGEKAGRHIREEMAHQGTRKSGPAFYQLMARLEDAGLVVGRSVPIEVNGRTARERRYEATGSGVRAWEDAQNFYASQRAPSLGMA